MKATLKIIYALAATLMLLAMARCAPHCYGQTVNATADVDIHATIYGQPYAGKIVNAPVVLTPSTIPATQPAVVVAATQPVAQPAPVIVAAVIGRPSTKTTGTTGMLTKAPAGFKPASGKTYTGLIFNDQVGVNGLSNVIFSNCLFDITARDAKGNIKQYAVRCDTAGTGIRIIRCEMRGMSSAAVYGQNFTTTGCYVHDSRGDGFKPTKNATIQGCYVTRLGMSDGAHADGVQIIDGNGISIVGNFFDMPLSAAGTHANSNLFLQKASTNVTFSGNWCLGGNYTVCAYPDGHAAAKVGITGNTFYTGSPRYGFGNIFEGVVWSGNVTDKGAAATPQMK